MNVELLRKVVEYAEAEPRRSDMAEWYIDVSHMTKNPRINTPPCGAVACLSGTACILSGAAPKSEVSIQNGIEVASYDEPDEGWFNAGRDALGLTSEQASRLFFLSDALAARKCWPKSFAEAYWMCGNKPDEKVKVLRERVEHFIATEGRE
jgi:hypothetical protein